MTMYAIKSAAWLLLCVLLLLWTTNVAAIPLHGRVSTKPRLLDQRQSGMEEGTPAPIEIPATFPTEMPTTESTLNPTIPPTNIPSVASTPVPTTDDTSQPTSLPTAYLTGPPTSTLTTAPTTDSTSMPSTFSTPSPGPTVLPTALPTTPSMAPTLSDPVSATNATQFRVPLADFQLQYSGKEGEWIPTITEQYLADKMKFDHIVGVELFATESRRFLQESNSTAFLSGNAIFGNLPNPPIFGTHPVPTREQVQESQAAALEDTNALQQAFDDVNVTVTLVLPSWKHPYPRRRLPMLDCLPVSLWQ